MVTSADSASTSDKNRTHRANGAKQAGLRWLMLLATFVIVLLLAATLGAPVPLSDLWSDNTARAEVARRIFLELRPPRLLAGMLIGAALASSGAALQAVFRNPLAEPYLLGISAGGALGATLATALQLPSWSGFEATAILAFVGSLAASFVVYQLGHFRPANALGSSSLDRATLLLCGVALSAFLSAMMALVVTLSSHPNLAQQTTFWLLGGLTRATMSDDVILAGTVCVGFATLIASGRDLNALRVGDEEAISASCIDDCWRLPRS